MNKYFLSHAAIEKDNPIYELLLYIANELAESNRLKRLDLELDSMDSYYSVRDEAIDGEKK